MPLAAQVVPVSLRRLDSKTDEHDLPMGDLSVLENVRFDVPGKFLKRFGFGAIGQASAAAQLAAYKAQLLVATGSKAYSLAASGALIDKGLLESLSVSALPARRDAYVQTTPDSAVHPQGVTVYTWETSAGGAQYSVFDTATAQPIVAGVSLGGTASKPKALAFGPNVIVLFYDTSTDRLRFVAIPAANPTAPTAAADFTIDPATTQIFDATVVGGLNGLLVVAYANNGVANKISLRAMTAALAIGAEVTPMTAEAFTTCCTVFGDSAQNVWVAYYTGTAVKVFVYDFTLSSLLLTFTTVDAAPGTVRNITGIVPPDSPATILYEAASAASYNNLIRTATVTLAGAVSGVGVLLRSVGLASKPFSYLGRVHVLAAYQSALQSSYFLLSGSSVVAKLAPSVGGGLTAKSILPEVNNPSAGIYSIAYLQADQLSSSGGNVFTQAGVMGGTLDFTQPQTSVELSDNLHLAGGILSMYDGAAVVEHGFHLYPENMQATPSGAGGAMATGSYQYVAVYEWMDAQGLVHQSSPSPPLQVDVTGPTGSVALTIPTLRLTAKASPISVVVYRTQANQSVFFRLTSISGPLLNTTAADTVALADTAADTTIGGNAQLVMNPLNASAELPNLAAPALSHLWRYRNRVAAIPSENPYQWIFSKAFVAGVPIEFNDQQLYQSVAQDGGALTCGIEMDEKNILFTATRIYVVVGEGPAANGTSPDYGSSPQNVPTDVGCSNRRSLVLTPLGVMFQASGGKGIYLLTRGLAVQYIGAEVEAFNGDTVTSARLVPFGNSRRSVFTLSSGVALAYDHLAGKWSIWTGVNAVDATIFQGLLTYARVTGRLLQETPGQFQDDGEPILIGLRSGWMSFAGLEGFQRVWRFNVLGDYRSPHRLTVSVAVDSNPIPVQTQTVDAGALLGTAPLAGAPLAGTESPGGGSWPGYEFVVKLARQKTTSVQITIQESQAGPVYGEGFAIHALTFLAGVKRGLRKLPATQAI